MERGGGGARHIISQINFGGMHGMQKHLCNDTACIKTKCREKNEQKVKCEIADKNPTRKKKMELRLLNTGRVITLR